MMYGVKQLLESYFYGRWAVIRTYSGDVVEHYSCEEQARAKADAMNNKGWSREAAVKQRIELRREIRQYALAMSGSVLGLGTPMFWSAAERKMVAGPVKRWQNSIKAPYNSAKRRAEKQLAALEKIHPTPAFFKPRPETATDKRIARQYKPGIKATFVNNRMLSGRTPEFYAERWKHKHRRQLDAIERIERNRQHAKWMAERDQIDARERDKGAKKTKPALRNRLVHPNKRELCLSCFHGLKSKGWPVLAAYYGALTQYGRGPAVRRNALAMAQQHLATDAPPHVLAKLAMAAA